MRQRNRLALGALAAAIVAIAAGAGAYAMRGSDEPAALYEWEPGTPPADAALDASRQPAPGGGPASFAMCAPGHPDCNDMVVQTETELTCEEANACAKAPPPDCPPDVDCSSAPARCAADTDCSMQWPAYECIEPQVDATAPCTPSPCDIAGGPAENVRCFPPEPCGPAPEPGGGGGGVMPMEPGVEDVTPEEPRVGGGGATPVEPPSGEPPADAPTPCAPPSLPPGCAISSDGAITCPDNPRPDDPGPGVSEPGSPGVAPPPVVATAVAQ